MGQFLRHSPHCPMTPPEAIDPSTLRTKLPNKIPFLTSGSGSSAHSTNVLWRAPTPRVCARVVQILRSYLIHFICPSSISPERHSGQIFRHGVARRFSHIFTQEGSGQTGFIMGPSALKGMVVRQAERLIMPSSWFRRMEAAKERVPRPAISAQSFRLMLGLNPIGGGISPSE